MTIYIPPTLSIRLSKSDKACLVELARRLQTSQSQTIRLLVSESLKALIEQDEKIRGL